ncbi:hypothetical protein SEMRO_550_G164650.1 [Seminavis robusta]|uniref:Uncharacterized protein n=1 Tax=Seminavis robusta TaxID=568900 RepID=A0A9N8E2G3_9STRA|nr:hypothetical protein SEMRO_550_G164650.1 [Seminavis robusta]|eukprot:Sro550_g164650.1 n/a (249) ;mRNA; f:16556-17302
MQSLYRSTPQQTSPSPLAASSVQEEQGFNGRQLRSSAWECLHHLVCIRNSITPLGLGVPTSFGMHKKFNYTTRKTTSRLLVRMILNNAVTLQDIEFVSETPRRLKIRVAWPDWFQMAEQMAQFTLDDTGDMIFPPEHPLTMDTSERNQQLVKEDGRIWNDGYLCFDQDMKDEDPIIELLDVTNTALGKTIQVLQIYADVAPVEKGTNNKVKTARSVNIGGPVGVKNKNARSASEAGLSGKGGETLMAS